MRVDLVTAVIDGERGSVEIARPKERALLALLALNPRRVVSADRLIDGLWGEEPPRTAAKTLQTYVKNLRVRISEAGSERDALRTEPPGYVLELDPAAVDLLRFEQMVADGLRLLADGNAEQAARLLSEALATVDGDPVSLRAPGLDGVRLRFDETRRSARDARTDALLAIGRHHDVIGPLTTIVQDEPQNERAWGQLMTALYREGHRRDALAAFARARERLADEFGLDPGPTLVGLERQILDDEVPEPRTVGSDEHGDAFVVDVTSESTDVGTLVDLVIDDGAWIERRSLSPTSERLVLPDVVTAAVVAQRLARRDPSVRVHGFERTSTSTAGGDDGEASAERVIIRCDHDLLREIGWVRAPTGWTPVESGLPPPRRIPLALARHLELSAGGVANAKVDAVLDGAVAAARRGERRIVSVHGAAGMGKTRAVADLASRLATSDALVLYTAAGRGSSGEYAAAVEAIQQGSALLDRVEMTQHASTYGSCIADMLPELAGRMSSRTRGSATAVTVDERDAALVDLLVRLGRLSTVVLIVDDAPLLDESSARVLTRWLGRATTRSTAVILTRRTDDLEMPPLTEALAQLCLVDGQPVELDAFSVDDVARYLETAAGVDRSPRTIAVAEIVHTATRGLPLFVREVARDIVGSGDWLDERGKWRIDRDVAALTVPDTLHDLVEQRLRRFGPQVAELLTVAAVIGEVAFDSRLLANTVELPIGDVLPMLDDLMDATILEELPGIADHYRFSHPLLRDAAASRLRPGRRRTIALAAAEHLAREPRPSDAELDRRAELLASAGPLAEIDEVVAELSAAAERARRRGAHRRRLSYLERMLRATIGAGRRAPADDLVAVAEAAVDAQVESSVRRQHARRAFEGADQIADAELAARAALAFFGPFNPFGSLVTVDPDAAELAEAALAMEPERASTRAELLGMLAAARSDVSGPAAELEAAVECATDANDPALLGRILSLRHALRSAADPIGERLATDADIIGIATDVGDRHLELQGWGWTAAHALEAGDIDRLHHAAAERRRLAELLDDSIYRWNHLVYEGMRATIAGRFEAAEASLWTALEAGRLPLGEHANRFFGLQLLKLSEMRGSGASIRDTVEQMARQLDYLASYVALAHLSAVLADHGSASRLVAEHVPDDLGRLPRTYDRLPVLAQLSRIAQLVGDADLADRVATELRPHLGELCVHADAVLYGTVGHALARCELTSGRTEGVDELLEGAAATYTALQADAWLLYLDADRATALSLRGDVEGADELRKATDARATDMGVAL